MSMPKNSKITRGYATIVGDPDALDFRAISDEMTSRGHTMNHSSARNYLIRALRKIAGALADYYELEPDDVFIDELVRSPDFHDGVRTVISERICRTPD